MDIVRGLIHALHLAPHPEGGYYRRVYVSTQTVDGDTPRPDCSAIFYLLAAGDHSAWHRIDATERWRWYEGAPIELLSFDVDTLRREILCSRMDTLPGFLPGLVAAHTWQAARSLGRYTLVACHVTPAFEFSGFELLRDNAEEAEILRCRFPEFAVLL